ncbi:molybdopterin-binding protein [Streptomyces uncialis]|uniref:molybdopterin molybdotransferase MoeA n=1 Tax=Streptomyces uncialis TaxID=1048205 RepID=UPI003867ED05|nr:molybdopterin-binding protein [Streptomyces uncialis]
MTGPHPDDHLALYEAVTDTPRRTTGATGTTDGRPAPAHHTGQGPGAPETPPDPAPAPPAPDGGTEESSATGPASADAGRVDTATDTKTNTDTAAATDPAFAETGPVGADTGRVSADKAPTGTDTGPASTEAPAPPHSGPQRPTRHPAQHTGRQHPDQQPPDRRHLDQQRPDQGQLDQRHPDQQPPDQHPGHVPWTVARDRAAAAGAAARRTRPAVRAPLHTATGVALAHPLTALTDLPSFDTSAMDGWAVSGPAPWTVRETGAGVLAGTAGTTPSPLTDGEAVRIATGARVPKDATAVVRTEHAHADRHGQLYPSREVQPGQDIRARGQECREGDLLMPAATLVTPAVVGLAAAAGYDTLTVVPRPTADILVLGDELLDEGLPHDGLIRDALGPLLPPWLHALGVEVRAVRHLRDDAATLHDALTASTADLIISTGGTAAGPADHVRPTLDRLGAELLVDGVRVRPGHPMLLARLTGGRHPRYLVGLPGNPLAAVSGLLTLAEPLIRALAGRPAPEPCTAPVRDAVTGHPSDTRLVPVSLRGDEAVPLRYSGPAMLRGIAAADAIAVVPPGGVRAGHELEILDLPWSLSAVGVCST